jgi:hypothetical protein
MKIVYFETGEIVEFAPTATRSHRRAIIRLICDTGKGTPRYRFSRPWACEEVRPAFRWW